MDNKTISVQKNLFNQTIWKDFDLKEENVCNTVDFESDNESDDEQMLSWFNIVTKFLCWDILYKVRIQ